MAGRSAVAAVRGIEPDGTEEASLVAGRQEPSGIVRRLEPVPTRLVALRIEGYDDETGQAELRIGTEKVAAVLDSSVEPAVMRTAIARRERIIAQQEAGEWVVLGALRTSATPGVDEGDEFTIRARRITVTAAHEFSVASGLASIVVRATGHVETLAEQITSRAAGVHKIIGRMLKLN